MVEEDDEEEDLVTQELGYISPDSSFVGEIVDVSSPPCSRDVSPEPEELGLSDGEEDEENEEEDVPSPQLMRQLRINSQPQFSSLEFGGTADVFPTPHNSTQSNDPLLSRGDDVDDVFSNNLSIAQKLTLFALPNAPAHVTASRDEIEEDDVFEEIQNPNKPVHRHDSAAPTAKCDIQSFRYTPSVSSAHQAHSASQQSLSGPSTSQSSTLSSDEDPDVVEDTSPPTSWGPDLADFFTQSQRSSDNEVASESHDDDDLEIITPRANRRRTYTYQSEEDEEEDILLSPERARIRTYPRDEDGDIDVDLDGESVISVQPKSDEERKIAIESKWREKWSNPGPSQTKRKVSFCTFVS